MSYELNYFSFHVGVDKLLEDLVTQLLALDPADRPNVKQARQHDWCRKKFPRSSQVCLFSFTNTPPPLILKMTSEFIRWIGTKYIAFDEIKWMLCKIVG